MKIEQLESSQPLNAKQLLIQAQQEISDTIGEWIEKKSVSLDEVIEYLLLVKQNFIQQAPKGIKHHGQKLVSYDEALLKHLNDVYPLNLTRYDNQFQSLKSALHRTYEVGQGEDIIQTQPEQTKNEIITQPQDWKEPWDVELVDQEILPPDSDITPQIGSGVGRESHEVQRYDKLLLFAELAAQQGREIIGMPKIGHKGNRAYPYYAIHIATPHLWTIYINNGHGQATYCASGHLDISDLTVRKSDLQAAQAPRIRFYGYQDPVQRSSESIVQWGKSLVEYMSDDGMGNRIIDVHIKKEKIKKVGKDRSGFTAIDHWKKYFDQQGRKGWSTHKIQKDYGGAAFYARFTQWNKKNSLEIRKQNKELLFPSLHKDRSSFTTITHWKEYLHQQKRSSRSITEIQQDINGGNAFYLAFRRRNKKQPIKEQKQNKELLFPSIEGRRSSFTTITHWKEYLDKQGWAGLNAYKIQQDINGGNAFYLRFKRRNKKQPIKEQKQNNELLFLLLLKDRSSFTTITHWKEYLDKQGWAGLNTSKIQQSDGGLVFYAAFIARNKKQPIENQESNRETLFGKRKTSK